MEINMGKGGPWSQEDLGSELLLPTGPMQLGAHAFPSLGLHFPTRKAGGPSS